MSNPDLGDAAGNEPDAYLSPTEISDPGLRREAQKAAIWIGLAALAALVVFFAQPLLVAGAGSATGPPKGAP